MDKKGKNNNNYKGEDAGYCAKHKWIVLKFGNANKCEICGKIRKETDSEKIFHWSNKNHKYRRKRSDWQMLCAKCHHKYDVKFNKKRSPKPNYTCDECGKLFHKFKSMSEKFKHHFCSFDCWKKWKKGRSFFQ